MTRRTGQGFWVKTGARCVGAALLALAAAGGTFAAEKPLTGGPVLFSRDKPIEITADTLDVDQEQKTATFAGNVDALQGDIRMKAQRITVFYDNLKEEAPAGETPVAAAEPASDNTAVEAMPGGGKIRKMVVTGPVHVSSPQETASGDNAVYDVDDARVTLTGNVILTRGKNIIRGSKLTINTETGRSIIESGPSAGGATGGRVSGVFMPSAADDAAGGAKADTQ